MKIKQTTLAIAMLASSAVFAAEGTTTAANTAATSFTSSQADDIGKIAADYIVAHPEVLVAASKALQQKEMAAQEAKANAAIGKNTNALFMAKSSPIVGNPQGSQVVIEFYDYQCGHCRQASSILSQLINSDKNVKVIYKELPIFGGVSDFAARASLASYQIDPSKYKAFHDALMAAKMPLQEQTVMDLAKKVGIDIDKLKTAMDSQAVKDELAANQKLAQELGVMGTPFFVLGNSTGTKTVTVPGAMPLDILQQKLASVTGGDATQG